MKTENDKNQYAMNGISPHSYSFPVRHPPSEMFEKHFTDKTGMSPEFQQGPPEFSVYPWESTNLKWTLAY